MQEGLSPILFPPSVSLIFKKSLFHFFEQKEMGGGKGEDQRNGMSLEEDPSFGLPGRKN